MNCNELKDIVRKVEKGTANKTEEADYNYYVACWGI